MVLERWYVFGLRHGLLGFEGVSESSSDRRYLNYFTTMSLYSHPRRKGYKIQMSKERSGVLLELMFFTKWKFLNTLAKTHGLLSPFYSLRPKFYTNILYRYTRVKTTEVKKRKIYIK